MTTRFAAARVAALVVLGIAAGLQCSRAAFAGTAPSPSAGPTGAATAIAFKPADAPIPDDEFGQVVRRGRQIFDDPGTHASQYVGNALRCTNCHLDEGRQGGSAPMWAAYPAYPAYRSKNHHVNTFAERLQGCFRFSMNGKAPPLGDPVLVALESYAFWLAKGAPVDEPLAGRGYPKLAKPAQPPDYNRGAQIYARDCALCHGKNGEGQLARDGRPAFPPLWGSDSYNWGAGMGSITNAAAFIRANMPRGRGDMLSEQEAWDVATFIDSQFHNSPSSMYGKVVNGHLLGSDSEPAGGRLRQATAP
jgi:thiosulfate dehydrogenase